MRLAVEQADSAEVYLDPGCRLFSSGATDDFHADMHKMDTLETGSAVFKLLIYPASNRGAARKSALAATFSSMSQRSARYR